MDKEEAKIREEKRKKVIERAKEIMFQNSDVAKRLASATLISDVMKEREYQAEVKKAIDAEKKELDQQFHQGILDKMKRMDEESARKVWNTSLGSFQWGEYFTRLYEELKAWVQKRERKLAQVEVSKMLKHQVKVVQERKKAEKEEQRLIGVKLRRQAEAEVLKEQEQIKERERYLKLQKKEQFESNKRLEVWMASDPCILI